MLKCSGKARIDETSHSFTCDPRVNKVKASHTRYRELGLEELIPVYRQSARRWPSVIHPAVGCHYFPPGPRLPSQPQSITAKLLLFAGWNNPSATMTSVALSTVSRLDYFTVSSNTIGGLSPCACRFNNSNKNNSGSIIFWCLVSLSVAEWI